MAGVGDFRDLIAWQLAHKLKLPAEDIGTRPNVKRDVEVLNHFIDVRDQAPWHLWHP
jgi:hypothetical protein